MINEINEDDIIRLLFEQHNRYTMISEEYVNNIKFVVLEEKDTGRYYSFKMLKALEFEDMWYEFLVSTEDLAKDTVLVCCFEYINCEKIYGELYTNCEEFKAVTKLFEERFQVLLQYIFTL